MAPLRVKNIIGGKAHEMTDPLSTEIEFDGQNYFFGPNEVKVIPGCGFANVSANSTVKVDDGKAGKIEVTDFPAYTD